MAIPKEQTDLYSTWAFLLFMFGTYVPNRASTLDNLNSYIGTIG